MGNKSNFSSEDEKKKPRDWDGNKRSTFVTLAASNHSDTEREEHDFYATDPKAVDVLLDEGGLILSDKVLEPCAGNGHIAEKLKEHGYKVVTADLVQREYPLDGVWDFLEQDKKWHGDIITNPPYKFAQQFIEKSMNMIDEGNKVVMFLKLQFLEGKARRKMFDKGWLKTVYVSSSRLICAMNGDFENIKSSAVCYGWFVFEKGYKGDPVIKWIN